LLKYLDTIHHGDIYYLILFFELCRKKPGPFAEFFPLIFGPLDFRRARNNLKACKNAAYMVEGIYERQLVRPLTVVVDSVTMYNFKADMSLADE